MATSPALAYGHVLSLHLSGDEFVVSPCSVFETVSPGAQAGLQLTVEPRLALVLCKSSSLASLIEIRGMDGYDTAIHSSVNVAKPETTFKRVVYFGLRA